MIEENTNESGLKTRQIAFDLLTQILGQKKPMDQAFSQYKNFNGLDGRDINFIRMVVATCLRQKGQIDQIIEYCQDKPKALNPKKIYYVLYIGLCQILYMDVPDHAAVDTTVNLAERENMARQKGFINAVLRRVLREKDKIDFQDNVNIPDWLMTAWKKDYGDEVAQQIAVASLQEAPTDITFKNQAAAQKGAENLKGELLPTGSVRLASFGGLTDLEGFKEGEWWVQDASAALPVKLLRDLTGRIVIDLCAAPGGKTMQLAAAGGEVIAVDRSVKRMDRFKENIARVGLGHKVTIDIADGTMWHPKEKVDVVLLDVPCSATGTIRRHPDLIHLKTEKDIEGLIDIQRRLMTNAGMMVKAGGILVYCTCSLQKSEGEDQVKWFLTQNPDFERDIIELDSVERFLNAEGEIRVLPHYFEEKGGMDGFFVAKLRRKP